MKSKEQIYLFLLLLFFVLPMDAKSGKSKVCLNMIVKDEKDVIERCLKSVKEIIDYWVIVDTGSHDGTQEVIRKFMKDIPGELHEQPWVNFGHNRNEALKLAKGKGDYVLLIDADEEMYGKFNKYELTADVYLVDIHATEEANIISKRALLIKDKVSWVWKGVLHEKLESPGDPQFDCLPDVIISAKTRDGNRAKDPQKYFKDAWVLEQGLIDEPDNIDYIYYLGQSYLNAGDLEKAMESYDRRGKIHKGWDQQTFWAKYSAACLQESLERPPEMFIKGYKEAFQFRPTRAEPLYRIAQHYYDHEDYLTAYSFAYLGLQVKRSDDFVYVEGWIYDYGLLAVLGNSSMKLGWYVEAIEIYRKLEGKEGVPEEARKQARETRLFLESELKRIQAAAS